MAIEFLSPISLNKLELQNTAIQNLATAPTTPATAQIYWDTALTPPRLRVYNGSAWVDLLSSASTGVARTFQTSTHAATAAIVITHNLTSQNIEVVTIRISDNKKVYADWVATSASTATVTFGIAPTANSISFIVYAY
jgi:hypothetical protein